MGLSLSLVISAWDEIVKHQFFSLRDNINYTSKDGEMVILKSGSFKKTDSETITTRTDNSRNLKNYRPEKVILERTLSMLERSLSFTSLVEDKENLGSNNLDGKQNRLKSNLIPTISLPEPAILFSPRPVSELDAAAIKVQKVDKSYKSNLIPTISLPEPAIFFSPRPVSELDAAAIKVQKVYKSYRTRRNLADCAVVIEELWWKALDFAALKRSSYSFFNEEKPETVVSKWARARTRAAKVGKGLSKDEKAQKLALQHWLEAIDPRHRYGHNLHLYYDIWFKSSSSQPFFYWLDVGTGKETDLEKCPRTVLQRQCIKYLGPKEREAYEVIVENGKLMFKQSGILVETTEGSKWIFVLSTLRALYVGKKKKGEFQHSSFLSGGATTAAGRLVAHNGIIEAIWPYSGHYHPTEENFREFIIFLEEHNVDLTNVKRCAIDDDSPSFKVTNEEPQTEPMVGAAKTKESEETDGATMEETEVADEANVEAPVFELTKRLSCKWTNGTGPRIGCVRDYPTELQFRALEQVNLSPRVTPGPFGNCGPIPSPRPSPKIRLSPRLAYMGLPSPRTPIAAAN